MSASATQTARDRQPAAAAMWDRMLGNVPTLLGKLVSVASFRVGASGKYSHPILNRVLSPEVVNPVLRESHEHLFAEWVGLFEEEQAEDVERYLESLRKDGARDLLRKASESLTPASTGLVARRAFLNGFELILAAGERERETRERSDAASTSL